jgi:hypothetical protein
MPHVASLFRIARWLTRNQTDAEDLLQETLLEALRSFDRFTQGNELSRMVWFRSYITIKVRRGVLRFIYFWSALLRNELKQLHVKRPRHRTLLMKKFSVR